MCLTGYDGWVWALDAKTGQELWRYKHASPEGGHSDAFKLETGERVWRCYMVPKPGEPGSKIWPSDGEAWQRAAATAGPHPPLTWTSTSCTSIPVTRARTSAGASARATTCSPTPSSGSTPGPAAGKEWTHAAYSSQTELRYAPVQDIGATATRRRRELKESIPYWGAGVAVDGEDIAGSISAFDPGTRRETWRRRHHQMMCASVLATAGNLVSAGEPSGKFNALNATTGEQLRQFQCESGRHSSPSTYTVDGWQYVVVPAGWGGCVEGFLPAMLSARGKRRVRVRAAGIALRRAIARSAPFPDGADRRQRVAGGAGGARR